VSQPALNYEELLHDEVAAYYADPLGFVLAMYPWTEPGMLEHHPGPDTWQNEFLVQDWGGGPRRAASMALRPSRRSGSPRAQGHGIGKSVMVAWLVDWLMSTRPHCQGTITANTITQLSTKTWAALTRWTKLCKTGHWFEINTDRMFRLGHKESLVRRAAVLARSRTAKRSPGSTRRIRRRSTSSMKPRPIPESIYEVSEGGLTDGEPFHFLFGNPTRSQGSFHKACFGSMRHRWNPIIIDSRDVPVHEQGADRGVDPRLRDRLRLRAGPRAGAAAERVRSAVHRECDSSRGRSVSAVAAAG
jgi:hypothetical protein